MDILRRFYSRTYEDNINKKMLYYDYVFPIKEMEDYVREIIEVPIEQFIQWDVNAETTETIAPKDVFQFSKLEVGIDSICYMLSKVGNPGVTFIEAGKLLLDDGKIRSDVAYIKYGENHLKTAEALGLLYDLTRTYFVSCIGVIYLTLSIEDRRKLITRLFLRNKLISRLIKVASISSVNTRRFLYMLSDTTYTRRKSSLRQIVSYLEESQEYDFKKITQKIIFS